jgi:hypothetical protein
MRNFAMGYFDALTSSYFKAGADGRQVFFPWGVLERGYALPSEEAYNKLRGKLKVYTIVALAAIIGTSAAQMYLVSAGITAALIGFYVVWAQFLLRGLAPVEETLSLRESYTSQALAHSAVTLWALEISSLVFVVGGVLLLVFDRQNRATALGATVFFGLCAVAIGFMIVQRKRRLAH